ICAASSRVGTRTNARTRRPDGRRVADKRCRIGSANAAVFPVPVCAAAQTSAPRRTAGMDADWTGVGCSYPFSAIARRSGTVSLSAENVMSGTDGERSATPGSSEAHDEGPVPDRYPVADDELPALPGLDCPVEQHAAFGHPLFRRAATLRQAAKLDELAEFDRDFAHGYVL